jgi:transketolase
MSETNSQIENLESLAKKIAKKSRISSLKMTSAAKTSHIGACLSVIDILASLFLLKSRIPGHSKDNIVLSKGHAAAGLYAVLDSLELLLAETDDFCKDGSQIYGHINHLASSEIPLSTGSLGHGLPFGVGMALAAKMKKESSYTYVVISDGELNEGTTWESALVAGHHDLKQLTVVVDRNRIQSLGFTEDILKLHPLIPKWEAFNWKTIEIDGHDLKAIIEALLVESDRPKCIIANTVKGKGVSFMEDELKWHYKSASSDELQNAINEILCESL